MDLIVYLVEKAIEDQENFEDVQKNWGMAFDEYLKSNCYENNELFNVLTAVEKSNSASELYTANKISCI